MFSAAMLSAAPFDSALNREGAMERIDSAADTYEYVGSNVIANGHVVIHFGNALLTADRAVFNLEAQDVELSGNVTYAVRVTVKETMTPEEFEKAVNDPYRIVRKTGVTHDENEQERIHADVTKNAVYLQADRAFLNIISGAVQFKDFTLKQGDLYATGEKAERTSDGTFTLRNIRFSTCNYLIDDHAHFALTAQKALIRPSRQKTGLFNTKIDQGDAMVLTQNSFLEVFGVPVFWLPVVYKAPEDGGFGGRVEFGDKSDWGVYFRAAKNFHLLDEPYLNVNLLAGYYEWRGFGYGLSVDFVTPESATELFYYGIRDKRPYYAWNGNRHRSNLWEINNSRLKIPKDRFEFRLANVTHITPSLDFRGQFDWLSDYNFLEDYFDDRYEKVLEPSTFISLEQQFERATASLYMTARVNDFYTQLQRLPELRLDIHRQELFANLYYQGETSGGYYRNSWRDFDHPTLYGNRLTPEDYKAYRFDTLHMFYYPVKFFDINFIPRAGIRLTAYSKSSDRKISSADLNEMFRADAVDGQPAAFVKNYDDEGGARVRFAGEIGFELNTKFYRTWQNLKSEFLGLDGLRHVVVPYINYTYIPEPTEKASHLYYFDEVDRIEENNFIRLGLINRLQTRRNGQIYEWFSMENYWDCFIHKEDGFNHAGDLGTILRFNPTSKLSLHASALFDVGQNNEHNTPVRRGIRYTDRRPGVSRWKYLNYLSAGFSWNFAPDWRLYCYYSYTDDYVQRSPYSMGSTLTGINASSLFYAAYDRDQDITGGLEFPLFFDDRTKGYVRFEYDVDAALMRDIAVGISRTFHCWKVRAEFGREGERSGSKKDYDNYFAVFVSLTAMPGVQFGKKPDND